MATIRVLKFTTAINTAGFLSGASKLESLSDRISKSVGAKLGDVGGHGRKAGSAFADVAKYAGTAALAMGGFSAARGLASSVKTAMDLGETVSKVGTIFGGEARAIGANADAMAAKFGLVKGQVLDASASFGLMGKAAGLSGPAVTKLSTGMANLAADVASFYNIDFEAAQQKLRAGLAGEAEPLRALGVFLSEDAVKAEALRMGLARAGATLTEQQKIQARSSLIMSGLKDATGDLERTQGSAANQARKLAGSMTNLGAEVGQILMPAVSTAIGLLNEFGTSVGAMIQENKATFEGWAASLSETFNVVGILVRNWRDVFEIAQLQVGGSLINIGEYFAVLGPNVAAVAKYIGENWYELVVDGINASLTALKNFGANITALGTSIGEFFADPMQGFKVNWTPLLDGFEATAKEFPTLLRPALTSMDAEIAAVQDRMIGAEAARAQKAAISGAAKKGVLAPGGPDPAKAGGTAGEAKLGGALELGSKEAYSAMAQALAPRSADEAAKVGRDQLTAQRQQVAEQKETNRMLRAGQGQLATAKLI